MFQVGDLVRTPEGIIGTIKGFARATNPFGKETDYAQVLLPNIYVLYGFWLDQLTLADPPRQDLTEIADYYAAVTE